MLDTIPDTIIPRSLLFLLFFRDLTHTKKTKPPFPFLSLLNKVDKQKKEGPNKQRKLTQMEEEPKDSERDLMISKVKASVVLGVVLVSLFATLYSMFEGRVAARLPFGGCFASSSPCPSPIFLLLTATLCFNSIFQSFKLFPKITPLSFL